MGVEASSTARSTTAVGEKIWGTSVGGTIQIGRASRAMGWASMISRSGTPSSRARAMYRARASALSCSTAARTRRAQAWATGPDRERVWAASSSRSETAMWDRARASRPPRSGSAARVCASREDHQQ